MKKRMLSLLLSVVIVFSCLSCLSLVSVNALSKSEIQSQLVSILYGGSGGYITCDFDGYTTTSGRHEGIDFINYKGAPVYSLISGTVVRAYNTTSSSNLSTLSIYDEINNKSVIYLHTANITVSEGDKVNRGDLVAYESDRGISGVPHTHIEVREGEQRYASKSVNDYTLDNPDPYSYWNTVLLSDETPSYWYDNFEPENLGDNFSARIRNIELDVLATNSGGNAVIGKHYDYKIARQIWNFSRNSNGSYKIQSCLDNSCMELHNFDDFDGGNVTCIPANGSTAQNWFIYKNSDGSYSLRPECSTERVLDIKDGASFDGNNLQLWSYNNTYAQKFSIEKCGEVINIGEDFSASIEHTEYWKPIYQNDDGNVVLTTSTQDKMSGILWHFVRDNSNGWYTITSYKNGKCLEVANDSDAEGAEVQCGDYNGSYGQHWYILKGKDESGNEYFYIKSACSSKNLDLLNNSGTDNNRLQMWSLNASSAQKFSIYTINGDTTYSIKADKKELKIGESTNIIIENTTFVISYKFHIISPDGKKTEVDNKCNYIYEFTPEETGRYVIYCEVESPVSKSVGSSTDRFIEINVSSNIGDVNNDGTVNVLDATVIQKYCVGKATFDDELLTIADVNGDGNVNVSDATLIQKYAVGLITEF